MEETPDQNMGRARSRFSATKTLTIFLSGSSAVVIVLALLGYGVALSAESAFAVPHSMLFNSSTDLLSLGGWAVIQMLTKLDQLWHGQLYVEIWRLVWPSTRLLLAATILALALGALFAVSRHTLQRWHKLRQWQANARAAIKGRPRWFSAVVFIAMGVVYASLAPLAVAICILLATVSLGWALAIIPVVGTLAGQNHIDEWVVGPSICAPLRSRGARLQTSPPAGADRKPPKAAQCISIKKPGGPEYKGRVVFASFSAVLLFDPTTGNVQRVGTDGASVEAIGAL